MVTNIILVHHLHKVHGYAYLFTKFVHLVHVAQKKLGIAMEIIDKMIEMKLLVTQSHKVEKGEHYDMTGMSQNRYVIGLSEYIV